jgi:hypothetical protein
MEISRFDSVTRADQGVELKLVDPVTKGETGAALILYGADSAVYKSVRKEIDAKNKALGRALSAEEISDQTVELLARCTKGWAGLEAGRKEILFSQEKAREIYKAYPEIAERAVSFVFNRANFFGNASAS